MKNKRRESAAASMAEVDWSELPIELLNLISKRLNIELDLIRFRSVCSNWRRSSSFISNHRYKTPLHKLTFGPDTNNRGSFFCYFILQNIFLIKPPPHQQQQTLLRPWLIRITKNEIGKTKLLRPFLRHSSPIPFPQVVDFNNFSVVHLKTNLIIDVDFALKNQSYDGDDMFPEKFVTVRYHRLKPQVLGTLSYSRVEKCAYRYGNGPWRMISDVWPSGVRDVCLFKGQVCSVDDTGRTIVRGRYKKLVAEPLGGGCLKLLVESEGDLLLADVYKCSRIGFPDHDPARIDLFKLNEKEKKWVKLTSLGDRVLFLGEGCSFTVSASDLHIARGNCGIFKDNIFRSFRYLRPCETCIFHLDEGRLSPLSDYPEYDNLFWPPPEWILQS